MTEATHENTNPETTAVPKTRREKLLEKYNKLHAKVVKDTADLAELASEINSIDLLATVSVGSKVVIAVGRGEEAKDVGGTVIGVKEDEEGAKTYKVQYGEGFDTDVAVVKAGKIKLPPAAELIAAADEAQAS